jgi:hypothetical protein
MEVAERQRVQRNRLSQDHEAILKERSLAKQISLRNKISIAEQRLATVMQDNRDIRVVNSAKSRLNSLKRDLQSTEIPEADNKSSLTIQDVAYVYINVQ